MSRSYQQAFLHAQEDTHLLGAKAHKGKRPEDSAQGVDVEGQQNRSSVEAGKPVSY